MTYGLTTNSNVLYYRRCTNNNFNVKKTEKTVHLLFQFWIKFETCSLSVWIHTTFKCAKQINKQIRIVDASICSLLFKFTFNFHGFSSFFIFSLFWSIFYSVQCIHIDVHKADCRFYSTQSSDHAIPIN